MEDSRDFPVYYLIGHSIVDLDSGTDAGAGVITRLGVHNTADLHHMTSVFQRYRKALARLIARIVKPHDIEDIVQETYIRIYQASQKRPIANAKSYMLKTARNLALNHVTRADALNHLAVTQNEIEGDGEEDLLVDEHTASQGSDALVQAEEEFLFFCRAVRELTVQCRRAFTQWRNTLPEDSQFLACI